MAVTQLQVLIDKIIAAGVVGAGGGGFPTASKLHTGSTIHSIIINGAECEPLLKVDQGLMSRYPVELLATLDVIVQATGAKEGVIALKKKYESAREALAREITTYRRLQLHLLPDVYPVGDEHILVQSVTGKLIAPGGLPLSVGAVVLNVETLYNIHQALQGLPVTHKYVTITGAVKKPLTVKVPLGVPVGEVLKLAGGPVLAEYLLIAGGPCMGKVVNPGTALIKTTKSILVLPLDHPQAVNFRRNFNQELKRALSVCCQCQRCSELCPRHLLGHPVLPHKIMRAITYSIADTQALPGALLCSECGLCELYACPFNLSPRQVNRKIKQEFQRRSYLPAQWSTAPPFPYRELRQVPVSGLINRLGLKEYDGPIAWEENQTMTYNQVTLPLTQHAGRPVIPVVQPGGQVKKGDLIAVINEGSLGAFLHASISGTVTCVGEEEIVIEGEEAS